MPGISVVIITLNEEANIQRCLNSAKEIADEFVVVDSFSTDRTVAICESYGCRVFLREFSGYGSQKQFAVDQAVNDWVLSIDADEIISPQLREELQAFTKTVFPDDVDVHGYYIPFVLNYMGNTLRHCGTGMNLRLFNRKTCRFTSVPVHESVEITGKPKKLKGRLIHYSYKDLSHHFEKINRYTSLAADGYRKRKKKYKRFWVAMKFPITFFIYYFIRLGILDGYQGYLWSFFAGVYASIKIAKSIELNEVAFDTKQEYISQNSEIFLNIQPSN